VNPCIFFIMAYVDRSVSVRPRKGVNHSLLLIPFLSPFLAYQCNLFFKLLRAFSNFVQKVEIAHYQRLVASNSNTPILLSKGYPAHRNLRCLSPNLLKPCAFPARFGQSRLRLHTRHLPLDPLIHPNNGRPTAFVAFAGQLVSSVNAQFAADGQFRCRVIQHIRGAASEN
jgi:hypothetical protein